MKVRLRTVDGHYVCVDDDGHSLTKDSGTATVVDDMAKNWPWVQVQASIRLDVDLYPERV